MHPKAYLPALIAVVALGAAAACSSGGSSSAPVAASPSPSPSPTSATKSIAIGTTPTAAPLPALAGTTGTVSIPSSSTATTVTFTARTTLPSGAPTLQSVARSSERGTQAVRFAKSETLDAVYYLGFSSAATTTMSGYFGFDLTVPSGSGTKLYVALYDPTQANPTWVTIAGPMAVTNDTVTSPVIAGSPTYVAGTTYYLALYRVVSGEPLPTPSPSASPTASASASPTASASASPTAVASASPTAVASASPSPSPTVATATLTGTVHDISSSAALSGFTVTVGDVPTASTCLASESASSQPCGVPAAIDGLSTITTTTGSDGSFSLSNLPLGTVMLMIQKDGTYATLHRTVTLTAGSNALGTIGLTALDATHQAWLSDFNNRRLTVSDPASYPNLVVDEYAQEQANQVVAAEQTASSANISDTSYATAYGASAGALYSASAFNYGSQATSDDAPDEITGVDYTAFNFDKSYCNGTPWTTCTPIGSDFGLHTDYPAFSSTSDVWIGLGYPTVSVTGGVATTFYYNVLVVTNSAGTAPSAIHRRRH